MDKLKTLLEDHKKLKLPDFPQDDSFADWVADLIEIDGYYVGLLTSKEAGARVLIDRLPLQKMKKEITKFSNIEEDKEVYLKCTKHLDSIEALLDKVILDKN